MSSKLDRLVAERVMKFERFDWPADSSGFVWFDREANTNRGGWWSPSSDISAAWCVKRAMYTKGFRLSMSEPFVSLIVSFKKGNDQGKPCGGSEQAQNEDKEPLAICLAALRACGVPEAEIQEAMTP